MCEVLFLSDSLNQSIVFPLCGSRQTRGRSLPPANEVCEGNVFTGVCHSVHRGACVVAPQRGTCVVLPWGVCGCSEGGGHVWLLPGGACVVAGGCVVFSMRYGQ